MTISELIDRVRLKTLIDDTDITDAEMLLWFNDGLFDIAMRQEWDWLYDTEDITTVASQANYTLSNTWTQIISIQEDATKNRLVPISYDYASALYGDDYPEAARARYYYILNGDVYLVPTPSASSDTYHVMQRVIPTQFTTVASDEPPFLELFHPVLAEYVEARVWEREEDLEKKEDAQLRFELGIRRMQFLYNNRGNRVPWAVGDGINVHFRGNDPFYDDWGLA